MENIYPNLPHADEESNPRLQAGSYSLSEAKSALSFFKVEAFSYFTI